MALIDKKRASFAMRLDEDQTPAHDCDIAVSKDERPV
jgi:hypothetical protein